VLEKEAPDIVLVQGDTNTVLAGTLAAAKLPIRVGHVEAGFVSFDRTMPEEINRVVADHISDLLFAPTETARQNLLNEGIEDNKISVTGNTIVDAVFRNLDISKEEREYPRHSWHGTEGLLSRYCTPAGDCGLPRSHQKHPPGDSCDPPGVLTARHLPDASEHKEDDVGIQDQY
jgi:ATP-dependent DNA ligase